jgi:hypothetical protein
MPYDDGALALKLSKYPQNIPGNALEAVVRVWLIALPVSPEVEGNRARLLC